MFWSFASKDEAERDAILVAFEDINNSNDRAAAIVAAAFLEDHLTMALKRCFHTADEKILNETFRSSGPLGSFSAKINMAFLIGLCSKEACKELHTIKDIRNEFAHKGLTRDFDSQRVRDLANNLKFGKKWKITIEQLSGEDGEPVGDPVYVSGEKEKPTTPREHYIKACQMLLTFFAIAKSVTPPTPEF